MQTEFRAIVQSEYGAPEKVLGIATRQFKSEELGTDDVFVRVILRPIHHGDIQVLRALPQAGVVEPIPEGAPRIPGLEGVGTILRLGTNPEVANLALKSVSIMSWFRLAEDEKRTNFDLALSLAINHPELFEVAHEYEFDDFQRAIEHVSRPGKTGIVLLKSPA